MTDGLVIEVDKDELLKALDRLPEEVLSRVKAEALITAENIQREARQRVPHRTGRTATGITIEETNDGSGYIISPFNEEHRSSLKASGNAEQPRNLPMWLEFGTQHMAPRPYFFIAAQLESGSHERRVQEAIQDAIDDVGLGD